MLKVITTNSNGDTKLMLIPNEFVPIKDLKVKYYDKGILPFFLLR